MVGELINIFYDYIYFMETGDISLFWITVILFLCAHPEVQENQLECTEHFISTRTLGTSLVERN